MDHSKQLGEDSIGKLLVRFSVPAIVGMLVNALYNIVDRVFVGNWIDTNALSGITMTFPIMLVMMAFGMLVGIGATSLISIRLGQQKKEEAEAILGNAFTLIIIISLLITFFGLIFLEPILNGLGATGEVKEYAKQFISIILAGSIFQGIGFGLNNVIRAEGSPKTAMLTMLIGTGVNIILNPLFILVFHMGIRGSALATVISQSVSAVWVVLYFYGKNSTLKIRRENLGLRRDTVLEIFAIGVSPFVMQISASLSTILFNKGLSTYGGDVAVAAMGVISSLANLILMPIFGINQGVQPIIGYNYGAKKYDRVKKALGSAIFAASIMSILGFLFIQLFPSAIISIFNRSDKELIKAGTLGIRIYLFMLPIVGFQIISSNYFQAVGKPKHAMFLSLSRQVIVLIPLILILPNFLGLKGVWAAAPSSDLISSVITGIFLFLELRNLRGKRDESLA